MINLCIQLNFFSPPYIAEFLNNERLFWIRIIENYSTNFEGYLEAWKAVIRKTSVHHIKKLAIAIQIFFKLYSSKSKHFPKAPRNLAPHHIAAFIGDTELFEYIMMRTNDKNPEGDIEIRYRYSKEKFEIATDYLSQYNYKTTPLHIAAMNGNFELCKLIMKNINGHPKDFISQTPLMIAAINGHLEICNMLIDMNEEKNPTDTLGKD